MKNEHDNTERLLIIAGIIAFGLFFIIILIADILIP